MRSSAARSVKVRPAASASWLFARPATFRSRAGRRRIRTELNPGPVVICPRRVDDETGVLALGEVWATGSRPRRLRTSEISCRRLRRPMRASMWRCALSMGHCSSGLRSHASMALAARRHSSPWSMLSMDGNAAMAWLSMRRTSRWRAAHPAPAGLASGRWCRGVRAGRVSHCAKTPTRALAPLPGVIRSKSLEERDPSTSAGVARNCQ